MNNSTGCASIRERSQAMTEQASAKEVDAALTAVIAKVNGVKGSLTSFVGKMEHEKLTWPSVMDSFASVSGHMSTLMKQLSSDKIPSLHNRVLLPLQVSTEQDPELEKVTEGRVQILHHELMPDLLRTKLDLELESRQNELLEQAREKAPLLKDSIHRFNEIVSSALERVTEAREEMEEQRSKVESMQGGSRIETKKMVQAYLHGQGLAPLSNTRKDKLAGGKLTRGDRVSNIGKAPSAMRTELKQAANTAPYNTMPTHRLR